jgi:hypothetical protein
MPKGPVSGTTIDRRARLLKTRRISLLQYVNQPPTITSPQGPERDQAPAREATDLSDSPDTNHG